MLSGDRRARQQHLDRTGFGFTPGAGGTFSLPMVGRFNDAMTAILTIGFISVWALISFWLLADRKEDR